MFLSSWNVHSPPVPWLRKWTGHDELKRVWVNESVPSLTVRKIYSFDSELNLLVHTAEGEEGGVGSVRAWVKYLNGEGIWWVLRQMIYTQEFR